MFHLKLLFLIGLIIVIIDVFFHRIVTGPLFAHRRAGAQALSPKFGLTITNIGHTLPSRFTAAFLVPLVKYIFA